MTTPETLTELLDRWIAMHKIYKRMAVNAHDEQKKMMIATMARQLENCIIELHGVMYKNPMNMVIAQTILKGRE